MRGSDLFFAPLVVRRVLLLSILTAGCLAVTGSLRLFRDTQAAGGPQNLAQLSVDIRLPASGRGLPHLNLADGRALLTPYQSGNAPFAPLTQDTAQPLALARADFDADGVPDLISGHADGAAGLVVLYRGNVAALYPAAAQRLQPGGLTDAPFLAPGVVWRVPRATDFFGAGDFDADGHNDIVTACRQQDALYLLRGDGHGGFGAAQTIPLPGRPTALVTGEVNRADGLQDIVIGVERREGPAVLVWEGPEGALRWPPEVFPLRRRVNALALGQFDEAYPLDVAVASGNELILLHGRDRQLSLGADLQRQVAPARHSRRLFPQTLTALAVGAYGNQPQDEIALLDSDGVLRVLSRATPGARLTAWPVKTVTGAAWPGAAQLVTTRSASLPRDNLLVLDAARRKLEFLTARSEPASFSVLATFPLDSAPVAVLPLRLNGDALQDLVLLAQDTNAPVIIQTTPNATFTVTNTNDSGPGSLRQAILNANSSPGADTIAFNISTGTQTRTINLLSTLPVVTEAVTLDGATEPGYAGAPLVELRKAPASNTEELRIAGGNSIVRGLAFSNFRNFNDPRLPEQALLLDDLGHNIVESNTFGPRANELNFTGILVAAPDSTIGGTAAPARNQILNSLRGVQVDLAGSGTKIHGNRIANNPSRVVRDPSDPLVGERTLGGVLINNSGLVVTSPVFVGGTEAGARNIINECNDNTDQNDGAGILVNPNRPGVLIQGNYIGTDETGQIAMGNGAGIESENTATPTIGGTTPAARNIISGNRRRGISTGGSLIQGNYIGLNATGTAAVSNLDFGIYQSRAVVGSRIGGAVAGARNVVSGNGFGSFTGERDGVHLISGCETPEKCAGEATPIVVRGNFIGTDASGTTAIPNAQYGLLLALLNASPGFTPGPIMVGGPSLAERNLISGNGSDGIRLGFSESPLPLPGGTGITIQNNYLGTDINGTANLGNQRNGIFIDSNSFRNTIRDNVIAFNAANGINIPNFPNPGFEIALGSNSIFANALLGINLGPAGVTPNDPGDGDDGANRLQNFPVLTGFSAPTILPGKGRAAPTVAITVTGMLPSSFNSVYTIHWYFSNATACGNNQNGNPLAFGRIPGVRTDGNGNATYSFPLEFPPGVTSGMVNATATDPAGNTSEFGACQTVSAPPTTNTFQFNSASYNTNEALGQVTLTVTRAGNLSAAATVDYSTEDLTAEQRSDYAAASGTLSFAPNETSKTFTVLLTDDLYADDAERFRVRLSNAVSAGAGLGTPSQAFVTITDNDPPTDNNRHFTARLRGAQVVPPFDFAAIPNGAGTGAVTLNEAETQATLNFSVSGLSSAQTAAHIHGPGLVGNSAPVLFNVPNGVSNINVTPAQVADLRAGRWYFDLHTANHNANGELRGQIMNALPEDPSFFVLQQYADFLSREPDTGGGNFWTQELVRCGNTPGCNYARRRWEVSNAFFFELEYQRTAAYVFRLYRAAYGNTQPFPNPNGDNDTAPYCQTNPNNCALRASHVPAYQQYAVDRARINADAAQLAATQLALATAFSQRPEFVARYGASLTGPQFVDAVLANIQANSGVNLVSQRDALIAQFNSGGRGAVLYRLADDDAAGNPINNRSFIDAEYNRTFVTTQYFGYLRRDADMPGLNFWRNVINLSPPRDVNRQLGMVCAFITSAEYQQRFGLVSPRGNSECP